jgi:hypothetical protein
MRRVLFVVTAALLVLPLSSASAADKWARGKVSAMAGDTITVDVKGESMTFTVDKATEVVKAGAGTKARDTKAMTGQNPTLADVLKVGDNVEVRYTEADGKMHATMIRGGISASAMTSADAPKTAEGVVSDVSGTSLSVKSKDETLTFVVDAKTKVVGTGLSTKTREMKAEGAAGVKLTDAVATGDTVRVAYKDMGGMKHATTVTVVKKGT